MERKQFYIGGRWVDPHGRDIFVSVSSTTEKDLGRSPKGDELDMNTAVSAARDGLPAWRAMSSEERVAHMHSLATALEKRADELGRLISQEVGTPVVAATRANVHGPAAYLRYFSQLAVDFDHNESRGGGAALVHREPVGVVGMIVPWNYPIALAHMKLAPAMAAGCTAVIKPSPETALSSYLFAEAVEDAGLPAGVVNIVPAGREAGEHLVIHPGVDKISFTGSTAAGRRIAELCGRALKPVTLELGGKSAAILLEDAPLSDFLSNLGFICMANNGQTCTNNTRVLVPTGRYEEVVAAVADTVAGFFVGDPLDPGTHIGPMVSAVARERIEGYIERGIAAGARVAAGGHRRTGIRRGYFVAPTVFRDVTADMEIARQEIFGPVIGIEAYDGDDDGAVTLANDSEYGLAGTVWTSDPERGLAVACRVDTGSIGVNGYASSPSAPFGGHKASGLGYEMGTEGVQSYLKLTSISGYGK